MSSDVNTVDPLAQAIAKPLRINFYIDGYHGYLLVKEIVALHQSFLKDILQHFPQYAEFFDFKPTPEKMASILRNYFYQVVQSIVEQEEEKLQASGVNFVSKTMVEKIRNPHIQASPFFKPYALNEFKDKIYFDVYSHGVVFCPSFERKNLEIQLNEYMNSLSVDSKYYELIIDDLKDHLRRLRNGEIDRTQAFYDALGDEIGGVSRKGFLKVSQNVREKIIGEKGVDGDMIAALASDAYSNRADAYVLLTNDSDHAPLAERLTSDGKNVLVIGYAPRPANALRRAVGEKNVINLLSSDREFDFSPVWLKDDTRDWFSILEEIRQQWEWWRDEGAV